MSIIKSKLSAKEKYLFQLKNALLLHFSHREIQSTLEDLDALFEAGKEDGRTEEETCRSLGTPKEFVDSLLEEEGRTRTSKRLKIYIAASLLFCAALAVLYTMEADMDTRPILLCLPVILIPAFVGYICGGFCLYRPSWKRAGSLKKYIVYLILSLLTVVVEQLFAVQIYYDYEPLVPYVPASYNLAYFLVIISIPVCLAVFFEVNQGGCRSLSVMILAMGTIGASASYMRYLFRYIGEDTHWYPCSLPYLLSIVAAIIYSLYMKKRLVKEKEIQ